MARSIELECVYNSEKYKVKMKSCLTCGTKNGNRSKECKSCQTPFKMKKKKRKLEKPDYNCCICMEEISDEQLAGLDKCDHKYCRDCITQWSKTENTCCICKKEFTKIISNTKRAQKVKACRQRPPEDEDVNHAIRLMMEDIVFRFIGDDLFKLSLASQIQNNPSRRIIMMVEHLHDILNQLVDNASGEIPADVVDARDAINALYAILPGAEGRPIVIPDVTVVIHT